MRTLLSLSCLVLSLGILIFADDLRAEGRKPATHKTQNVDFEGDTVDGKGVSPDGAYLLQKRSVDFVPLYKVREQFDDNIKNSIDYLK